MQQVSGRVTALVNHLRAEAGYAPLEREPRLDAAAAHLAAYMAHSERLDHRADGVAPRERVRQRGYMACTVSENIAAEYSSRGFTIEGLARSLVEGWRDSPLHRGNMLDPGVSQTGIGIARSARGEYYATQVFAQPMAPGAKGRAACPR